MIIITEDRCQKMPGITSLFIGFDYNASIVDAIKTLPSYTYDKKTHIWEIPITCLAKLLEILNPLDDIVLNILPDSPKNNNVQYTIGPFKTKPFKHQEEAVQFGLNNPKFLLLDAPGLGKTKAVIDLATELKKRENLEHCLIICGINTLKMNWKKEIAIHSDLSSRILGERTTKKGKLKIGSVKDRLEDLQKPLEEFFIITNVETLRNDDIIKALNKGPNNIGMMVVDEIHKCANVVGSQQGKNLLKLSASHMIGATGTLLTSKPTNAYGPLKWIDAEHGTFTNFKFYYCNYTGQFNNILIGFRNLNILQDQIDKYSLRRTKDLLDLPPKNIIHEYVELEPDQEKFYNDIKEGIIKDADLVDIKTGALLSMITRLRQATSYPGILSSNNIESSKINRACDLAEQMISNGEKVVIFSVFKPTLDAVAEKLKEYNPLICTGDIKDDIVSYNIDLFQNNPEYKVMLATVQKMSTGVTLTAATNEIVIDCAWTAADNEQMEDRIYRVGTKNPVFIYYLWNTDTVDERVKEIVEDKELISDYVIDDKLPTSARLVQRFREIIENL